MGVPRGDRNIFELDKIFARDVEPVCRLVADVLDLNDGPVPENEAAALRRQDIRVPTGRQIGYGGLGRHSGSSGSRAASICSRIRWGTRSQASISVSATSFAPSTFGWRSTATVVSR